LNLTLVFGEESELPFCYRKVAAISQILKQNDKQPEFMTGNNSPGTDEEITLFIPLHIAKSLDLVATEMGITREKLIIHILNRWKVENRVNTGPQCSICQVNPESPSDEMRIDRY